MRNSYEIPLASRGHVIYYRVRRCSNPDYSILSKGYGKYEPNELRRLQSRQK